jgi:hypothetical protein
MQRLKGTVELVHDTVEVGSSRVEEVHQAIGKQVYAVLEQVPLVGGPAKLIGLAQQQLTTGIYWSIRAINDVVGFGAGLACDWWERRGRDE